MRFCVGPDGIARRMFLRTAAVGATSLIAPSGCDLATVALLIALIRLYREVYDISEDVDGEVELENSSDETFRGEMLVELVDVDGDGVPDYGIAVVEVPAGKTQAFKFEGLYGEQEGTHRARVTIAEESAQSDEFRIVAL